MKLGCAVFLGVFVLSLNVMASGEKVALGWYVIDGSESDPTIKIELMKKSRVEGFIDRHLPDGKAESFKGKWMVSKSRVRITVQKKVCVFDYKSEMENGPGTIVGAGLVPVKDKSAKDFVVCDFSYIKAK